MIPVRRALVSLADKKNIEHLAVVLGKFTVEIVATGGTHQRLHQELKNIAAPHMETLEVTKSYTESSKRENAQKSLDNTISTMSKMIHNADPEADPEKLMEVGHLTGFPEVLDGRVKTLHPAVHAGILARKSNQRDRETLAKHNIMPFDLVVVNLYPFVKRMEEQQERLRGRAPSQMEINQLIEEIDIGGIAILRAAAKNYQNICLITDPDDYDNLAEEMEKNKGSISEEFRKARMAAAFEMSAAYDSAIADYFGKYL